MSTRSIEAQLERMARELIAIAKTLNCSVHLNVTKYRSGIYGGTVFKVGESATSFDFREDKKIDFAGLATDKRHLVPLERQDEV